MKAAMDGRRLRGFTIIELMIVMVIVGVLATIAAPSMRDIVVRTRLKTAASDLHVSLTFARSEAIKRNNTISVIPANAADWSRGWRVEFAGPPIQVLARQDAYQEIAFATTDAANAAIALASLSFAGTGRCAIANCPGVAFVLTAANSPTIRARCVILDPSGRAAVRTDRDGNPANGC